MLCWRVHRRRDIGEIMETARSCQPCPGRDETAKHRAMFRHGAGVPGTGRNRHVFKVKKWLIFMAKAAISVLLIWWLISRIDLTPVAEAAGRMSVWPVVMALGLTLVATVALSLRWVVVCRALDIPLAVGRSLWLTFVGQFFSQTLPSTIGGDVVRIWFFHRDGVSMEQAAISVILDRFCALAASLLVVVLTLPVLFSLVNDSTARWSIPTLILAGTAGIAFLIALGGRAGLVAGRWRALRPLVAFGMAARRFSTRGVPVLAALALASVIIFFTLLTVWLIGQSIASGLSMVHCLILVPPVILVSMVPVSIAGWGVREGAMVVAFGFVDIPAADALVVSMTFGALLVATGIPGGILWLLSGRQLGSVY